MIKAIYKYLELKKIEKSSYQLLKKQLANK